MGALHVYHNDVADILNVAVHGVGGHLIFLGIVQREPVVLKNILRFRYGYLKSIIMEQMLESLLIERNHTPGKNGLHGSLMDKTSRAVGREIVLGIVIIPVISPAEAVLRNRAGLLKEGAQRVSSQEYQRLSQGIVFLQIRSHGADYEGFLLRTQMINRCKVIDIASLLEAKKCT